MTAVANLARGALHSLRVVEWGTEISAPYASRLLADLGADVIKIECGSGDPMRLHEPFHLGGASALFAYLNAGKRAVRFDPERERANIIDLISRADILIEDLGPGGLERARLGPTELRAINPLLNIVRLSDYGQQFSETTVTEFILQAQAGWIEGREGETRPLMVGGRLSEYIAGAYLAAAALTALRTSGLTSSGVDADVSRLECAHSMLCCPVVTLRVLEKLGGGTNRTTLLGTKPCRDGWAGINVVTQRQWADLCELVGAPEYAGRREEFRQGGEQHNSFENHVSNWTRSRTVLDVVDQCQGLRIPAVALHDGKSIMEEPQWLERPFFTDAACPDAGFVHPPSPWRLSETPAAIRGRAPALGEHDDELPRLCWEKRSANVVAAPSDTLPLKGLKVLSLGTYWSGSSVASYLGAMGADVVKVESIQRPDGWRFNMVSPALGDQWYERGRYRSANLNQRDITLDLDSEDGRAIFARLLHSADLVIENFAAAVVDKLGFAWDTLHAINPKTIMLRLPGFGLEGPRRNHVGFGPAFSQMAGHAALTGLPDGPPQSCGGFLDPTVGIHAVVAVLAALESQATTGLGQLIEVPQVEVGVCISPEPIINFTLTGEVLHRTGNRSASRAPQGVYSCSDGRWLALSIGDDAEWRRLTTVIPLSKQAGLLANLAERIVAHDQLDIELTTICAQLPGKDLFALLEAADIPVTLLPRTDDFPVEPHLAARGFFQEVGHKVVGPDTYPGWPIRYSAGASRSHRLACPLLGEHNEEVLGGELGLSRDDLASLAARGVIGTAPAHG